MSIEGNNWYHKLARFIEKRGGKREIWRNENGKPSLYLERYYIVKTPWMELMIHRFFLGDKGPLHDHPALTFGWILETGYYEKLCTHIDSNGVTQGEYKADRRPGNFGWRPGSTMWHSNPKSFHKVILRPGTTPGSVWTLFGFCRRNNFSWGFRDNDGTFRFYDEQNKLEGTANMQTEHTLYKGWFFPRKVV